MLLPAYDFTHYKCKVKSIVFFCRKRTHFAPLISVKLLCFTACKSLICAVFTTRITSFFPPGAIHEIDFSPVAPARIQHKRAMQYEHIAWLLFV